MERSQEHQILYKIAEVSVSYKSRHKFSECPIINCTEKAYEIWLQYWNLDQIDFVEHFKVMLLNRANRVIGISDISTSGVSGTVADPKVIFVIALKANASSIILAHNHPSGNLNPSQQDINLTNRLKQAGEFLQLSVLDHMIITRYGYYSFADEGLM